MPSRPWRLNSSRRSWPYLNVQGIKMKNFVIHETRSYFVAAHNEEEAMDKFFEGEYYDKSDCDYITEPWEE